MSKQILTPRYYGTDAERAFIDGLGSFAPGNTHLRGLTREQLLNNYALSVLRRERWGTIQKKEVIEHVKAALNEEALYGK